MEQQHLWAGHVTQVIDPHYFWMQLGSRESLYMFEQLQLELQRFCTQEWSNVQDTEELERGQVVVVDTGDLTDRARFRRGQIARITSENSLDVFYVDYGNTELTTVEKVCVKFPPQFKNCHPQAVRCTLSGVKPISKTWTNRGVKTFQSAVLGHMMNTLVLYGTSGYCEVALFSSSDGIGRSVAHHLLDEDVALPVGEVPEFVSQVPEFMARFTLQLAGNESNAVCSNNELNKETKPPASVPDVSEPSVNHSPNSSSKPVDRYAPVKRKHPWESTSSQESNISTSPSGSAGPLMTESSTSQRSPKSGLALNTSLKVKEQPVVDFFPFETVSTYPPSPVSPVKSPTKSPISAPPGFTRGPGPAPNVSRYQYNEAGYHNHNSMQTDSGHWNKSSHSARQGDYHGYTKGDSRGSGRSPVLGSSNHHRGSGDTQGHRTERTNHRGTGEGRVHRGEQNHHRGNVDGARQGREHHERNRFAARFNNFPDPEKVPSTVISGREASAALEPSFLQSTLDKSGGSPQSGNDHQPSYHGKYSEHGSYIESPQRKPAENYMNSPSRQDYGGGRKAPFYAPRQSESQGSQVLRSPEYYQHYHASHTQNNHSYHDQSDYSSQFMHQQHQQQHHQQQHYQQQQYHDKHHLHENGFSNQHHQGYSPNSKNHGNPNNSNTHASKSRPRVDIHRTPGKYPGSSPEDAVKRSPISPESPAIAAFDIEDLEHTQHLSTDDFYKQFHHEKLQKLKVEHADIEKESREQSELARMARYCGADDGNDFLPPLPSDLELDQMLEDTSFSKFGHTDYEQLKASPSRTRTTDSYSDPIDLDMAPKLTGMPSSYLADIDFCEALREALDFGKSDGNENAKLLVDGIVESLRSVPAEKQLYDVVSLLVSRAVEDFNQSHTLIMETIDALNAELEIKEHLARALKRQQEICVRFPRPKPPTFMHLDVARVMALIYKMATHWSDSNSSIQDCILGTLEKWVVFNNKGTQIGQSEKENVFLDCFGAFWEISGKLLLSNTSFTSRIHGEIRKKVLNEQVARSIRERLLDMLQELSSPRKETQDAVTQTVRRTMIPSSCQVKPHALDKSSQTHLYWTEMMSGFEDDYSLDDPWVTASEKLSLDVSLRPQGQPGSTYQSTPVDTDRTVARTTGLQAQTPTGSVANVSEISSMTDSLYATPNGPKQVEDDLSESVATKLQISNVVDSNMRTNVDSNLTLSSQKHKQNCALNKDNRHSTEGLKPTRDIFAEKTNQTKKSVVDWFEYVSEGDSESNKTDRLEGKRLEARKHVENVVDINEKYMSETKENKSKHKKNKKAKKQSAEEIKPETPQTVKNKEVPKKDPVTIPAAQYTVEIEQDKPVDWWGVGGDVDLRPPPHTVVGSCDIYTDPGPDVIIEEEVEHLGDDDISAVSETFEDERDDQILVNDVDVVNETPVLDAHNESLLDPRDEFGSDKEDAMDDWESGDDNVCNIETWSRVEEGTDGVGVDDTDKQHSHSVTASGDSKRSNSTKYTTVKLSEFINSDSPEVTLTSPQRWVPGKRVCVTCHDPNHTTDCCPNGVKFFHS